MVGKSVDVSACVARQLDELEAMRAVYGSERVEADPPECEAILRSWCEHDRPPAEPTSAAAGSCATGDAAVADAAADAGHCARAPPCELGLVVWLESGGGAVGCRFRCPPDYPDAAPPGVSVAARSGARTTLPKATESAFAEALSSVVADTFVEGDECALQIVQGAEEALEGVLKAVPQAGAGAAAHSSGGGGGAVAGANAGCGDEGSGGVPPDTSDGATARRLLWSHHIKSTTKKKLIVAWARELGLSGYCKPGYPGIIVVEGAEEAVAEYWRRLRRLTWKALVVKGEETHAAGSPGAERRLPPGAGVEMLGEGDMAALGQICRESGLHDLFMTQMH